MTILVCGNEGEQMLYSNALSSVGADTQRRGSTPITVGNQMFKQWTASTDIWVHARWAGQVSSNTTGAAGTPLTINSAQGHIVSLMDTGETNLNQGFVQIQTNATPATAPAPLATKYPYAANEFHNWDFRIQTTMAGDLTLSVYRDEVLRLSATGTGFTSGASSLTCSFRNTESGEDATYWQDIIVTNGIPTVGMELATLVPSAVGNYDQFTNNYTNIDDLGYDPSNSISTNATGQRESWIFSNPTFSIGDKIIYGVALDTVAQRQTGGAVADFQPFLRIGGTDYANTNIGSSDIAPDSFVSLWTTNPSTSQPWQQSELSGLEAGLLTV